MSELHSRQVKFCHMVSLLIQEAFTMGYEPVLGEAWRTPEQAALNAKKGKGIKTSLHCDRLALDLLLFKDGMYLTSTPDYTQLGTWWEGIGGTWGGRFNDGNHFALSFGGRK